MNVFYADLENPISISVPGIPNERLSVSINNGTITPAGNGKFIVKVKSGTESKISVLATMENGERRNMGVSTFRVRQVPKPTVKFGGLTADGALSKGEIQNITGVIADYQNFIYNVPCKVLSCTFAVQTSAGFVDYKLTSNMIASAPGLDTRLKQMRRGGADFNNRCHRFPPIRCSENSQRLNSQGKIGIALV
jgi:hypothetical protein